MVGVYLIFHVILTVISARLELKKYQESVYHALQQIVQLVVVELVWTV